MHDTVTAASFHAATTPQRDQQVRSARQGGMTEPTTDAPTVMTVKPGYCPVADCRIPHFVTPIEVWTGHRQWRGSHHGAAYVYEAWMVA